MNERMASRMVDFRSDVFESLCRRVAEAIVLSGRRDDRWPQASLATQRVLIAPSVPMIGETPAFPLLE